jgi:hypothetical protein
MAKQTGLGDNFYIAGYNISGDIIELGSIQGGPEMLECTGIDKSAMERIGGLRSGSMEVTSWFNPATSRQHKRFSTLPYTDTLVTYARGTTLGNPAACMVAKQIDYKGERDDKGSLTFEVEAQANGYGLEWGTQLTAGPRTDTGATAGTGVDFGTGSTTFGLQAYLHVFSFSGTDVTIKLQESSDNSGDAYADVTGGGFTQVTSGPTWERIATATNLTVERYLKVTTVTSGGFSSCAFSVVVMRNDTAPAF